MVISASNRLFAALRVMGKRHDISYKSNSAFPHAAQVILQLSAVALAGSKPCDGDEYELEQRVFMVTQGLLLQREWEHQLDAHRHFLLRIYIY